MYGADDPARVMPRFQRKVDRRHALYKAHQTRRDAAGGLAPDVLTQMHELESHCLDDMTEIVKTFDEKGKAKVAGIFDHMTGIEMNFYK